MLFLQKIRLASFVFDVLALISFSQPTRSTGSVDPVILTIDGIVPKPQKLTAADLAKLPRRSVEVKNSDGTVSTYEGPILADVLALGGVVFGPDLKGDALANYVTVTGADKFRVVFALPELDSSFTDRLNILADKRDGKPLSASEGPLRNIVPDEKRRSRWVSRVVTLTVLSAPVASPSKNTSGRKHN
jgi:DMSO/TMAO reductase YedYZ molybdopterin-dependent catalytic subunit